MSREPPDERLVYSVLRSVLQGDNAKLRHRTKVNHHKPMKESQLYLIFNISLYFDLELGLPTHM